MNQWVIDNVGVVVAFFGLLLTAISLIFGILTFRSGRAITVALATKDATIDTLNATITHLNTVLATSRNKNTELETEKESAEAEHAHAAKGHKLREETIVELQNEISQLHMYMADHPCLVNWNTVYKYAFPEPSQENTYLCAECWESDRKATELVKGKLSYGFGRCPIHRKEF